MIDLIPTIVLCIALFFSMILYLRIQLEVRSKIYEDDWYITPILMLVVSILWSYLFYLLH